MLESNSFSAVGTSNGTSDSDSDLDSNTSSTRFVVVMVIVTTNHSNITSSSNCNGRFFPVFYQY